MKTQIVKAVKRMFKPKTGTDAPTVELDKEDVRDNTKDEATIKYGLTAAEKDLLMRKNLEEAGMYSEGGSGIIIGTSQLCTATMQMIIFTLGQNIDRNIDVIVSLACVCSGILTFTKGGRCSCPVFISKIATAVCIFAVIAKSAFWFSKDLDLDSQGRTVFFLSILLLLGNILIGSGSVYFNTSDLKTTVLGDEEAGKIDKEDEEKAMKIINEKIQLYVESKKKKDKNRNNDNKATKDVDETEETEKHTEQSSKSVGVDTKVENETVRDSELAINDHDQYSEDTEA